MISCSAAVTPPPEAIPLLDLHQKLIRVAAREGRPLSDYFLDGLHMNEEGNRAIAEAAAPALRKIMER